MKILLATYWYLPHVGGVDSYMNILKRELENRGHQVDILAHHPDMTKIYLLNKGKEVPKPKIKETVYEKVYRYYSAFLPHVEPWIRYREIERYTFELISTIFNLEQYDLIHTQDIVSTRALWRVKPKNVPLVASIHGLLAYEHILAKDIKSKDTLAWHYVAEEEYFGAMSSDITIVPSKWLRNELVKNFSVSPKHIHVIPYGIDIFPFLSKMNQPPFPLVNPPKNKFIIICPARLVPVKGHSTLIKALSKVKKERRDFVCWIIGDGKLRKILKRKVIKKGMEKEIKFLGDRTDVGALMKLSDIVVLPSLQDNLPYTIMEAQIAGKPIVASNAGGIPEMIENEKTGLLFRRGKSKDLKKQLIKLMEDGHLRRSLQVNARTYGRNNWTSERMVTQTFNIYNKVLKKGVIF